MGIQRLYSDADIAARTMEAVRRLTPKVLDTLNYIGLLCMENIENHRGYQDQTGNLKSSTGWVTAHNGRIEAQGGFNQVLAGAGGGQAGEALARSLAAQTTDGFCLIVAAGMHYARHVEARGYNVIASAEILAERLAQNLLQQIFR